MKQQLARCLRSDKSSSSGDVSNMTKNAPQWVPELEAEPGTEVLSGDLYLLSGPVVDCQSDTANNNDHHRQGAKLGEKSGSFCKNHASSGSSNTHSHNGKKRGPSKIPVHVKVYRSCFGHYAVVTSGLRAPAMYLNLRMCNCRPCLPASGCSASSVSTSSTPSSLSAGSRHYHHSTSSSPPSSSTASCSSSASSARAFRVELGGGEGQVIYFEVRGKDSEGMDGWLRAFQSVTAPPTPGTISPSLSPVIPRSPIMPTLQESIEEEDEEEEEHEQRGHGLG